MSGSSGKKKSKRGRKKRVALRRNRAARPRITDLTKQAREAEDHEFDAKRDETVRAKGELSRHRTVTVHEEDAKLSEGVRRGVVVAMRGLFANVDDGERIRLCTVRRILRTRLIEERHPVTVGDRVRFLVESRGDEATAEGVIEAVEPRRGQLRRRSGRRIHTMVANVDQALIVSSAGEPSPKPHLIDRYIIAALAGEITPVICMNKTDLDTGGEAVALLDRYSALGYAVVATSTVTGAGIESLRKLLHNTASVIAGQSGVGKSSLLNVVEPGLKLDTKDVSDQTRKGRHTTTTATLIRLAAGGYVVDTPGIRSLDLTTVDRCEYEALFVEFPEHVANCKFPGCTHRHEIECAVKSAVERGDIHPDRYESYVRLFENPGL